jgi:hypothetical protein
LLLVCLIPGCGSRNTGAPSPIADPAEANGASIKQQVADLQRSLETEGIGGVASNIVGFTENLEGQISAPPAAHAATYKEILAGARDLARICQGGKPAPATVQKKIDELAALTEKLPGPAPSN